MYGQYDKTGSRTVRFWQARRLVRVLSAVIAVCSLVGCANGGSRIGLLPRESPVMTDINRVYNWNLGQHIVTKVGNVLVGVAGAPLYLFIEAPINAALYGKLKTAYSLKWFGSLGGVLVGSLALPITLWFPRDDRPEFLEWYPPIEDLVPDDYGSPPEGAPLRAGEDPP